MFIGIPRTLAYINIVFLLFMIDSFCSVMRSKNETLILFIERVAWSLLFLIDMKCVSEDCERFDSAMLSGIDCFVYVC